MPFNIDTYKRRSAPVALDGVDFSEFARQPLDAATLRCISYMHDIEHHTICYLRDLLVTPAHRDHEMTTFLTMWALEEYWHGEALGSVLAAHGEANGGDRVGPMRMRLRVKESLSPLFFGLGSAIAGRSFAAIHMTWGAINEWTAQAAYGRLAQQADHPTLSLLLKRIQRQEGGHIDFYASQATKRLDGDSMVQRARLGSPCAASGPRSDPTSCPTKRCGSSTTTSSAARTVGPRSSASTVTSIDCLASPACISPPERARSWLLRPRTHAALQFCARSFAR